MARYSVKVTSPLPLLLFATGLAVAYFAPLEGWAAYALVGVGAGIATSVVSRNAVVRTFEPADAPVEEKQQAAVVMAVARLLVGAFVMLLGAVALAHWLAPTFDYAGGFLIGGAAITPLRVKDFA